MEEMHYFKESQREEIPVPDFKDNITRKLLLQFLCDLCTWAQATPVTSVGIKKDAHILAASSRCRNTWTAESAFFSESRLRRSFVLSRMSFAS